MYKRAAEELIRQLSPFARKSLNPLHQIGKATVVVPDSRKLREKLGGTRPLDQIETQAIKLAEKYLGLDVKVRVGEPLLGQRGKTRIVTFFKSRTTNQPSAENKKPAPEKETGRRPRRPTIFGEWLGKLGNKDRRPR